MLRNCRQLSYFRCRKLLVLEELDVSSREEASDFPQGCGLHSIPTQLRSASRLQHLRIGADGTVLRIERADLETLSAMRSLTFLSLAKVFTVTALQIFWAWDKIEFCMRPDNCMSCADQTGSWALSAEGATRDASGLRWAIAAESVLDIVGAAGASTAHGAACRSAAAPHYAVLYGSTPRAGARCVGP